MSLSPWEDESANCVCVCFLFLVCKMLLYSELNGTNMFLTFPIKQTMPKPIMHNFFSKSSHKPDFSSKAKGPTDIQVKPFNC